MWVDLITDSSFVLLIPLSFVFSLIKALTLKQLDKLKFGLNLR